MSENHKQGWMCYLLKGRLTLITISHPLLPMEGPIMLPWQELMVNWTLRSWLYLQLRSSFNTPRAIATTNEHHTAQTRLHGANDTLTLEFFGWSMPIQHQILAQIWTIIFCQSQLRSLWTISRTFSLFRMIHQLVSGWFDPLSNYLAFILT